jgi:two-component system, sensor histidine kinase and response regulator
MKKVLIIEDELILRDEVADWLRFENYDVAVAGNGVEGIELAVRLKPDIILCDIMMPVMDGKRFLYELKTIESTSMIPFIFMSALSEREHIRDGMVLGADDYVTKPFTRQELLNAVNSQLQKYAAIEEKTNKAINSIRNNIITYLPHELRTPLNSIIGYSSMLSDMAEDFSYNEISEMGRTIAAGGKRLHRLIENYLLYVQLELVNEFEMGLVECENLEPILFAECFQVASKYVRSNCLKFSVEPAALMIDENMLRKIVYELVDNAFKFSGTESIVEVNGKTEGNGFSLVIKNNGRSISQAEIKSIGAFMQFDRDTNEQQGSGLGLILVKRMLEIAGGRLEFLNTEPNCTEVKCWLPSA